MRPAQLALCRFSLPSLCAFSHTGPDTARGTAWAARAGLRRRTRPGALVGTGSFAGEICLIRATGISTGYAVALAAPTHWFGMAGTGKGFTVSDAGSGSWAATASSETHRNHC